MRDNVNLLTLFPGLELGEEANALLQQNTVENVDLRVKEREVSVVVRSAVWLPLPLQVRAEQAIREAFELRAAHLELRYDPDLLPEMDYADLTGLLAGFYPPAPATLAGCRWEAEGTTLHAHLRGNGLAELKPHLRHAEQWLSDCFGAKIHIELHGGKELTAEELFAETKRIRDEAMESIPAPTLREAGAPAPAKTQNQAADLIFGKPFFHEPVPMPELSLLEPMA